MDHNLEYHDPDYPDAAVRVKEEPRSLSEDEKVDKIRHIVRREISNELEIRENEVMLIDQRMTTARRLLHRLRYTLVTSYYKDQKLQLSNSQIQDAIAAQHDPRIRAEMSLLLRDGQRQLHPSVRKLLGKKSVDISEIFKTRAPRNKTRKDYSAMLQKRNYTISADTTKTLRPDRKPDVEMEPSTEEPCTSQPKKIPRHLDPKITNVVTLNEATRNKMKHRYRIIIGNTSKYAPPASRLDRSTHKWLLYVRGAAHAPDLAPLVSAVTVRLHHSYAPHHTVHLQKPPFHITRRGWGEFPAKIELHFALPDRNRPATVEHTIKLDRNYTGMQILGSETLVDVWLYSTQEMLQYEYHEEMQTDANTQPPPSLQPDIQVPEAIETNQVTEDDSNKHTDNWLEFFTKEPTELDVDGMIIKPVKQEKIEEKNDLECLIESNVISKSPKREVESSEEGYNSPVETKPVESIMEIPNEILSQPTSIKKRIVKYIDPTTGKIYYLEMDRKLDLSKVQEIVINNTTTKISPIKSNGLKNVRKKKGGVSLLKPEVKNQLKNESNTTKIEKSKPSYAHIENDHCYLATPKLPVHTVLQECINDDVTSEIKKEQTLHDCLCSVICRFTSVRAAVNYLVKKIPLVSDQVRDPDFLKHFPFVVENYERFWKMDFAKRRNIEWSRAKLINRLLTDHFTHTEPIWRTKQILLYSRLHGHYPIRNDAVLKQNENHEWSSWNDFENIRKLESNIKEMYPSASDINTLSIFKNDIDRSLTESIELSDDEEVDIDSCVTVNVKKEAPVDLGGLTVLPVESVEERMKFLFIERKCADIGLELRNEDIGHGYSYSAVHAVMLSAVRSFAEELVRNALADKLGQQLAAQPLPTVWAGSSSSRSVISLEHVYRGLRSARLHALSARDTATERKDTHAI